MVCLWCFSTLHADRSAVLVGNESLDGERIESRLAESDVDPERDEPFSADELERAARIVRQLYQSEGFPLVRVMSQMSGGRLSIHIEEGPRAELGWVRFRGNHALPDQRLSAVFKIGKRLDFDSLEQNLDTIRQLYRDAGYAKARVDRSGLEVLEVHGRSHFPLPLRRTRRNRILLEIKVEEGPRFHLGAVRFPEVLRSLEIDRPLSGETYDESRLVDFRERVFRHFNGNGKLIREFQILQRFDEFSSRIDLEVRFELYPTLNIRRVEFLGNKRYPGAFFRRELAFEEGDILDTRQLARSIAALNSTGVLHPLTQDGVELIVDGDQVDIVFQLKERKSRDIWYSLSRGDLGGIQVSVILTVANFLGLGEKLGLEVNQGGGTTGLALSIASRYLLGTDLPVSWSLSFFRRTTGLKLSGVDNRVKEVLRSKRVGFSGSAAFRVRETERVGFNFTLERFTRPETTDHLVLQPFWKRDWIEDGQVRRRLRLANRFSLFDDSVQAWNWRPEVDYLHTKSVGERSRFRFRVQAAHARYSPGPQLFSERLFSDNNSIRGFANTTAGPWGIDEQGVFRPLGGDTSLALSTEYRISLNRTFSLAPFVDSGINFSSATVQGLRVEESTNRILRSSVGSELRIALPKPFPGARLIAAWNPLRLDRGVITPNGLARLRDPKSLFRIAFDPVF